MATEVLMPRLGDTMTEGRVLEWRKKEGEAIRKGEILLVIETEKVNYEFESPTDGVIGKTLVAEKATVSVGMLLCVILAEGEILDRKYHERPVVMAEKPAKEKQAPKMEKDLKGLAIPRLAPRPEAKGVVASPLAKMRARELGVDLASVKGTGFFGRIKKRDVELAEKGPARKPKAPIEERIIPWSSMRQTIAKRMSASFQTIPHFYLVVEVDVTETERLRKKFNAKRIEGCRVTVTDMLVKSTAVALKQNPIANSRWSEEGIHVLPEINIGMATSVMDGLIVPVIWDAYNRSILEIAEVREDLLKRAKENKLRMDELSGSTFTISNLGMYPIEEFVAIINPPESAILAVGKSYKKLEMGEREIVERVKLKLTASFDHRVLDGVAGAKFLTDLKEILEEPGFLSFC